MEKYYFDKEERLFYPLSIANQYDKDFSTMKLVSEEKFNEIVNGQGERWSDEQGNPILIPLRPSSSHTWNGTEWVIDEQKQAKLKAEQQTQAWENIKAERYRRTYSGIYLKSVDKWFHTDEASRIQYLSIQQLPEIPENLQWKTMDNSFIQMTKELLNQLLLTMIANEQADFANAEKHRLAMLATDNPLEYDYSTGWSKVYE